MLKEILSISGKSGLYKLISRGRNMLIVENLADGVRTPAFLSSRAVALTDIAIFTDTSEIQLGVVFTKIFERESGHTASIDAKADNDALRNYFSEIIPDFDRDKVHPSDIRKIINWYNILVAAGVTNFDDEEKTEKTDEEKTEQPDEEKESVNA